MKIDGLKLYENKRNIRIYHAGTKKDNKGDYITDGGRVLNIVTKANKMKNALELNYEVCKNISWQGCFYRKDIGS